MNGWMAMVGEIRPHEAMGLLRRRFCKGQHDVALATGIPANYISMYERGSREIPAQHMGLLSAYYSTLVEEEAIRLAAHSGPTI